MTTVMVAGGGVGGLATAIALEPTGVEPVVYEKASDLRAVEVGAGITLWPNAVRMLDQLGVGEEVRSCGSLFTGNVEQRTFDGRLLSRWQLEELGRKLGAPAMAIRRPVLHEVLARAAGKYVTPSSKVASFESADSNVTVSLADGRTESGDGLVGADGIDSVVRAQLLGAQEPRYSGLTIWRAVTDFDDAVLPPGH